MLALTRVGEAVSGDVNVIVESISEQGQKGEQRKRIFFWLSFYCPNPRCYHRIQDPSGGRKAPAGVGNSRQEHEQPMLSDRAKRMNECR